MAGLADVANFLDPLCKLVRTTRQGIHVGMIHRMMGSGIEHDGKFAGCIHGRFTLGTLEGVKEYRGTWRGVVQHGRRFLVGPNPAVMVRSYMHGSQDGATCKANQLPHNANFGR
jgi:hypothetical protein